MDQVIYLDRRSRYSMNAIRQALFELLETKSLDEISVVELCAKADVNRGTFYKYYRDVPDLYDKTEDSLVEELYALMDQSDFPDTQDDFYFKNSLRILVNKKEFLCIANNKAFSQRLAQKLLAFYIPHFQQLLKIKCPHASAQEADLLLEYVLGGCIRVISDWLKNGMQIPIEEIDHTLSAMISHSLSMYQ